MTNVAGLWLWLSAAHAAEVDIGPNNEIRVDGEPFFPIMQWVQSGFRIEEEVAYGFNTFVGNGGGDGWPRSMRIGPRRAPHDQPKR